MPTTRDRPIQPSGANDNLRGPNDPDGAIKQPVAERGNLDLEVDENGVLTGEVGVGCKMWLEGCTKAFNDLSKINNHKNVDIKFNKLTVYEDSGALDLEIRFDELGIKQGVGVRAGNFSAGSDGFFGFGATPDTITIDYDFVGDQGTMLHEFGHALGIRHMVNSSNSIMSYSPSARSSFTSGEINAIIRAYR